MVETSNYAEGDWVVQRYHGVGQIEGMETRKIGAKANTYCKIQTHLSTVWLPVENINDEWLRPIASRDEVELALDILRLPPRPMADNIKKRQNDINSVAPHDSPAVIAELIRDLWALKKIKTTLSQVEDRALRHLTDCSVAEWSKSMGISKDDASQALQVMLAAGREKKVGAA